MRFRHGVGNFVAHAVVQRQLGSDLEIILRVKSVVVPLVPDVDADAQVGALHLAEQETGPGVPTRTGDIGWIGGGLRVEFEQAGTVLAASDIELLAACFSAKLQAMPSVHPGNVFVELRGLVYKA